MILDYSNNSDIFNVKMFRDDCGLIDALSLYVSSISFNEITGDIIINFVEDGVAYAHKNNKLQRKQIADYENKLKRQLSKIGEIVVQILNNDGEEIKEITFNKIDNRIQLSHYKYYFHANQFSSKNK